MSNFFFLADDYRLFCGDLGNEVNDDVITKAFSRFPSFNMARVSICRIRLFCSAIYLLKNFRFWCELFCILCSDICMKCTEQLVVCMYYRVGIVQNL